MTKIFKPALLLLLAGAAMPVHAAEMADAVDMEAAGGDSTNGEIVVSGLKFDRSLQDTPTSVKVFTSEDIERLNLVSVYDLINRTANLSSTWSNTGFNIRGISSTNVSGAGFGDLATVYLDGSPLPREVSGGGPLDLWDLEQVEILRGPQSTLQGRNALAGAIILKTADPSFDWRGKARAMITDADGTYRFAAAVGGPIIDDVLAFRVAGEIMHSDGLIKNSFAGGDYAKADSEVLRAKLLFTPWGADSLRIVASYLYDQHSGIGRGSGYSFTDRPDSWTHRTVEANRPNETNAKTEIFTLDASLPLSDIFTLSSISTYNRLRTSSSYDGDLRPVDETYGSASSKQKIFSQEMRLTFDTGALQGLVGAYYSHQKMPVSMANSTFGLHLDEQLGLTNQIAAYLVKNGLDAATAQNLARAARQAYPESVLITSITNYPIDIQTQALFGDASWEVAPGLKLLAGFRYDRERQKVRNENIVTLGTPLPNPAAFPDPTFAMIVRTVNGLLLQQVQDATSSGPQTSTTYKAFLPKGGVSFEFAPDKTVSAIVQRGYRSGGSSINPGRARTYSYDPEYTWNYELSLRTQWLDRRLTLNANAFYIDWTDQQVSVQLSDSVYDYETRNVGKSRVWGFEVESDFDLTSALNVYASAGYANSKFLEFNLSNGLVQDLSGHQFANAPRWTAALGFDWRHASGVSVNVNANYRGAQYQNVIEQARRSVPARTLVNAKIGWSNENVGAYLVATNIFDEKYFDYQSTDSAGRIQTLLGDPRLIGLTFEGRF